MVGRIRIGRLFILVSAISLSMMPVCRSADLYSEAADAFKAGQYDVAIAKYTEALKRNGKNPSTYNNRALAYRAKKDYARALADFGESLRLKKDWYVYYNRGNTYQDKGDFKSAITDLTQAIQLSPPKSKARTDCLLGRAHIYFNQERSEPAMADLNLAIKMNVDDPDAYILRGILHKIGHEYDKSLADYEKAIALDPDEPRSYNVAAFLLSVCPAPKYRNGKKAITYATKACELTKWKDAKYVETLAAAYAEAGDFDQAIKWEKKATEIDSKEVDSKNLALYREKQPRRELNRKEEPVPNLTRIPGRASILMGQRTKVQLDVGNDGIVQARTIQTADEKTANLLSLDFHEEKAGRVLLLSHHLNGSVQARCLARLKGYDTYFETDILPVPPNRINREVWSEPIEELVLFDFKIKPLDEDEQSSQLSAVKFSRPRFAAVAGQTLRLPIF